MGLGATGLRVKHKLIERTVVAYGPMGLGATGLRVKLRLIVKMVEEYGPMVHGAIGLKLLNNQMLQWYGFLQQEASIIVFLTVGT